MCGRLAGGLQSNKLTASKKTFFIIFSFYESGRPAGFVFFWSAEKNRIGGKGEMAFFR